MGLQKPTPYCHGKRNDSIEDKEPTPTGEPTSTVHPSIQRSLQVPTEHGANKCGSKEDARSLRQLSLRVPTSKNRMDSGVKGAFRQAYEEATSI